MCTNKIRPIYLFIINSNSFLTTLQYAPHTEDSYIDEEEDGLPENRVFSDDLSDFDEDLEDEEYDEVYDLESELKSHLNDDELDRGSGDHIDDDEDDNDRTPHRLVLVDSIWIRNWR